MKRVTLAYSKTGLPLDVPDDADILTSYQAPGLPDEAAAILEALRHPIDSAPLRDRVKPSNTVAIVHTDITRATPNALLLPILLHELESAGVQRSDITLINALGTHRPQTDAELRTLLSDFVVENYHCIQHDAWDDANLVSFGVTARGNPVRINRAYAEADVRILTGFIEPHFFAGFSGGPKGVLPSIAGFESVLSNHGLEMIAHPNATWGVTRGNPIWEEMCEMAQRTQPTFLINVTMNDARQLTGVFAGDMLSTHAAGCAFVADHALIHVDAPYDVVITTNSGYPLDQNLYQTIKGVSAGARVVRKGGAVLMCAACNDGLPNHGKYAELLRQGGSPQGVLDMLAQPGFHAHDQWQVQIQAQIQPRADVYIHSDGLSDDEICHALFKPLRLPDGLNSLMARYGNRLCVIPNGPQVIPTLKSNE
ncbi:MAG TPA: nickel-dependent lactate racemase [Anaerolineales bacterium]|nr:nickel-dependent lactate racemase [Anaerolineales bacterium]